MEEQKDPINWLNYHHLRYFYAVAKEGSLIRASEKLNTSQPSICTQLKQLEGALGERLYIRSGRSIALTDFGRVVLGYAEEIFAVGRELTSLALRGVSSRVQRLSMGIVDSFPKLLSLDVLRPVFESDPPVRLSCHEGKIEDLLGQLAAHRLDAILADEPAPSNTQVKAFSHPLGVSGVTFCGMPKIAKELRGKFPQNLQYAPLLLPTQNTSLRRDLESWFRQIDVQPNVVAEFEDGALAKIVASDGYGITVVPTVVEAEAVERHGFEIVGRTKDCVVKLFLITPERRIEHPSVVRLIKSGTRAPIGQDHKKALRTKATAPEKSLKGASKPGSRISKASKAGLKKP